VTPSSAKDNLKKERAVQESLELKKKAQKFLVERENEEPKSRAGSPESGWLGVTFVGEEIREPGRKPEASHHCQVEEGVRGGSPPLNSVSVKAREKERQHHNNKRKKEESNIRTGPRNDRGRATF